MSYLDQLEALSFQNTPPLPAAETAKSTYGSNDSAQGRQFSETHTADWDAPWRSAARDFYNHLFACTRCYAPRNRYCPVGLKLRNSYYGTARGR